MSERERESGMKMIKKEESKDVTDDMWDDEDRDEMRKMKKETEILSSLSFSLIFIFIITTTTFFANIDFSSNLHLNGSRITLIYAKY